MAGPPKIPDAIRTEVVLAVESGERKAKIARRLGISDTSVTNIARSEGLADPPMSEARRAAIRAVTGLNQDVALWKRTTLAVNLFSDVERMRKRFWRPYVSFDWGGKDHAYAEHVLPTMPPREMRDLAIAISMLTERAMGLIRFDREDTGTSAVKASILQLTERLAQEEAAQLDQAG